MDSANSPTHTHRMNQAVPLRIYTVHDKEPGFLRQQIQLLRKFCYDDYELVVLNNALAESHAREIESICIEHGVRHVLVPDQHHENPNIACSYPLDYLMAEMIRQETEAKVSVIIDSDMFPLRPLSFVTAVGEAEIAAVFQSRGRHGSDSPANHVHYLWNGLVIFNHAAGGDFSKIIWACSTCLNSPYYPAAVLDANGLIEGERVDVGGATHAYLRERHAVKFIDWERVEAKRDNLHLIPEPLRLIYQPFFHSVDAAADFLLNGAVFHYRAGSNWNHLREHLIKAKKVLLERLIAAALGTDEAWSLKRPGRHPGEERSRVLVGICSCRATPDKRQAVRETWFPVALAGVDAVFFVGEGMPGLAVEDLKDVMVLDAPDDYDHLPAKVIAFFRQALAHYEFDWIFKCDDDTYVVPERLLELTHGDHDLAGNEFLEHSGYASGGAGYLLSREWVERLAKDASLETIGAEDLILSGAAVMMGARGLVTDRLCWDGRRIPRRDNSLITTHWLAPDQMRAVHTIFRQEASSKIDFVAGRFQNRIYFHENGAFDQESGTGYGLWDLDDESNLVLEFAPQRDREVCPVGHWLIEEMEDKLRIGVLVIATGRYRSFIEPLLGSVPKNFLPQHERTVFLFTDADQVERPGVRVVRIENRPWPGMSLLRYAIFRDHAEVFDGMDYLFYMDADMRVTGHVGNEILSDLTAVVHPSFDGSPRSGFTYESNPESCAYVPPAAGDRYFCGGFQGGARSHYLAAAGILADRIENDLSRGIVAKWHDESHWNRYLIDQPPGKVLSPSYCHPEGYKLRRPEKITALAKDHAALRSAATSWPKTIVARLGGGIANQLFCYANGLALARFFGASLELQYDLYERGYALEQFGIPLTPENGESPFTYVDHEGYLPGKETRIREAAMAAGAERIRTHGCFQNERYFLEVADELRSRFRTTPRLPAPCADHTPVCLQVRRGDYVGNPKFDLCTEQYFRDGMMIVRTFVEKPMFFILSDDLAWCRRCFADCKEVVVPDSQTDIEGMQTMMACQAFVISNSTFGWWGAWLSEARIVVAPDPWLGDQHWDCVPSRWIRIPAAGLARGTV